MAHSSLQRGVPCPCQDLRLRLLIKYGERPLSVDRMAQIRKDGDLKPGEVAKGRGHHFILHSFLLCTTPLSLQMNLHFFQRGKLRLRAVRYLLQTLSS